MSSAAPDPAESQEANPLAVALIAALSADRSALDELRRLIATEDSGPDVAVPPAYTANTLATALGVSPKTIRNAIARGELAAVKRGGRWIVSAAAVDAWAGTDDVARRPRRRVRSKGRRPGPLAAALVELESRDSGRRIAGP